MTPGSSFQRAPDLMSAEERLAEVARLLARAYLRLRQKRREKALALSAGEPLLCSADGPCAAPQKGDTWKS
jgi:hypothetical protein